jgi:hypothetical protein
VVLLAVLDPVLAVGLPLVAADVDPPDVPRPVLELPGCGLPASPEGAVADVPHASAHVMDSEIARMCG